MILVVAGIYLLGVLWGLLPSAVRSVLTAAAIIYVWVRYFVFAETFDALGDLEDVRGGLWFLAFLVGATDASHYVQEHIR